MSPELTGFLLALGAGLCTTIGGAFVFFVQGYNRLALAACLAVSAGVMTYVSLVEILAEGKESISKGLGEAREPLAYLISTVLFFSGWCLASLLDWFVDLFITALKLEQHGLEPRPICTSPAQSASQCQEERQNNIEDRDVSKGCERHGANSTQSDDVPQGRGSEVTFLNTSPIVARSLSIDGPVYRAFPDTEDTRLPSVGADIESELNVHEHRLSTWSWIKKNFFLPCCLWSRGPQSESNKWETRHAEECFFKDQSVFLRMGVFTALALTIHNIPEGVATFTGALASKKMGFSIAVAIGIHNIPEGFAVSVPLYFGTKKRWSSFFYSVITGLAEPLGAGLAWLLLSGERDPVVLGVAFSLVSGIMTNISLKELLPTAIKYDPCNEIYSACFFGGMLIMALSLVVFSYA